VVPGETPRPRPQPQGKGKKSGKSNKGKAPSPPPVMPQGMAGATRSPTLMWADQAPVDNSPLRDRRLSDVCEFQKEQWLPPGVAHEPTLGSLSSHHQPELPPPSNGTRHMWSSLHAGHTHRAYRCSRRVIECVGQRRRIQPVTRLSHGGPSKGKGATRGAKGPAECEPSTLLRHLCPHLTPPLLLGRFRAGLGFLQGRVPRARQQSAFCVGQGGEAARAEREGGGVQTTAAAAARSQGGEAGHRGQCAGRTDATRAARGRLGALRASLAAALGASLTSSLTSPQTPPRSHRCRLPTQTAWFSVLRQVAS
jgi:hypothetical protein